MKKKHYKKRTKVKCDFCGKEILGTRVAGMVGKKLMCNQCGIEFADIIWHQLNLQIKSKICDKLDRIYHKPSQNTERE